ncbi:hypothetical protein B0A48_17353 [Cryoendolithus antarcticus]|uniref:Uncharacterized protein n=1 Tax=Cryoendolithus antarcticus TaxID=1507870 RepID=A0A1V8SCH7_9PEZI|nr:hypothetical protein B0A48_17353 [Cryoendolithus antarcticus]
MHGLSDCSVKDGQPYCIPSDDNVTFAPVSQEDQLFSTYYLDIAPYPIIADRTFFVKLHGYLKDDLINDLDATLADATFNATTHVSYENGRTYTWGSATFPLRAQAIAQIREYLAIRDMTGRYVEHLSLGYNAILIDGWFSYWFTASGNYTFAVDARLPDGRCLFAFEVTQWIEGAAQ